MQSELQSLLKAREGRAIEQIVLAATPAENKKGGPR
jgi:hypothetical protein